MSQGTMTKAAREAFLAALHVGILAVDEPGSARLRPERWRTFDFGKLYG